MALNKRVATIGIVASLCFLIPVITTDNSIFAEDTTQTSESVQTPSDSQRTELILSETSLARWGASIAYVESMGSIMFGGITPSGRTDETWLFDGSEWTQLMPSHSPSARQHQGMAYDKLRERIVLYGGTNSESSILELGDTWEFDGVEWIEKTPTNSPGKRTGHELIFRDTNNRIILFGGWGPAGPLLNDTWEYDGSNWYLLNPASKPEPRFYFSMAYDSERDRVVVFGGCTEYTWGDWTCSPVNDTWEFDGLNWYDIDIENPPPSRTGATMAYDPVRRKIVLFGGCTARQSYDCTGSILDDTWEYDGSNWIQVSTTSPGARYEHILDYHSGIGATMLFGGRDTTEIFGDTWSFDGIWRYLGGTPSPVIDIGFLDLPFEYASHGSVALLNWDEEGGRVRSWFDHDWPDFNVTAGNDSFVLCSGNDVTSNELYSYDDHNGYDFTATGPLDVYAAAGGTVYESRCGGYGNQVVIAHPNGVFTLYGHLQGDSILVTKGEQVTQGQPIGIMGGSQLICDAEGENCYCKQNGFGAHLHFGLYRDNGDGIWREAEVVDPNGWFGPVPDPWVDLGGTTSSWLWSFERSIRPAFKGSEGTSFTGLGGSITIDIPPGFYEGDVTMELLREPPVAEPSATLKSAGYSFWLRLLEFLDPSEADSPYEASSMLAGEAITIAVAYTDTAVIHLDEKSLSLAHWDESSATWEPIASTVDLGNNVVTAEADKIGHFSLHAPLLCEQDESVADDCVLGAVALPTGMIVDRVFDIETDEDWFSFEARVGWEYIIQTGNLASNVDTYLEILDVDETTQLAEDDNSGEGLGSRLIWRAPSDGTYFARISQSAGSAYGCASSYQTSLSRRALIYLPIVLH